MDFTIRKALPKEADHLSNLALQSKAFWGYNQVFMRKCIPLLTISQDTLNKSHIYVLEARNKIVGFYQLEVLENNLVDLDKLFVDPNSIKRGYGSKLLKHAIKKAKGLGFSQLLIESDPNAREFYEQHGAEFKYNSKSPIDSSRLLPTYIINLR